MRTFLTIDLDFWNYRHRGEIECRDVLMRAKEVSKSRRFRIQLVDEHHKILSNLNRTGCERVINLDFHSDIANNFCDPRDDPQGYHEGGRCELNCGTWVNYVKPKLRNQFLWIHSNHKDFKNSYCHYPQRKKYNPFIKPSIAGWNKAIMKGASRDTLHDMFDGVKGISIAISYDWLRNRTRSKLLKTFVQVFGEQLLPKPRHDYHRELYDNAIYESLNS